jgi:hypothetical protein
MERVQPFYNQYYLRYVAGKGSKGVCVAAGTNNNLQHCRKSFTLAAPQYSSYQKQQWTILNSFIALLVMLIISSISFYAKP